MQKEVAELFLQLFLSALMRQGEVTAKGGQNIVYHLPSKQFITANVIQCTCIAGHGEPKTTTTTIDNKSE